MICPDCGHQNRSGELLCGKCGADLYSILLERVSTRELQRNQIRQLDLEQNTSTRPLLLYSADSDVPLVMKRQNNLVIGRSHPDDPVDVDLNEFGAHEKGVSRHHARIDAFIEPPVLIDLGSTNGTFVNGKKLTPQQPQELHAGDEIRFGSLVAYILLK